MIGRRSVLTAGGAALWVGAPAIVRAQNSSKVNVAHGMAMPGITEYRPGVYVFNDATQVALGVASLEQ